jgi:hypothetical protein
MTRPINRMVHDAIVGAAQEAPSSAPKWIAHAMLDAYGEQHAVAIADSLAGKIRAEHAARIKGAAIRACQDAQAVYVVKPGERTVPAHFGDDYPGAVTVTDHADLQAEADDLHRGWRIVRNIGIAACVALLAWGFWTAGNMTLDAVQRQIEAGAVEW